MTRIKELDSLRAIAILLVMVHHAPFGKISLFFSMFPMGANIFFVLSGFLITSILLKEKNKATELAKVNRSETFRNFFVRRALRIFPLYFLVLAILILFDTAGDQSRYWYYGTFTSNFYIHNAHYWPNPGSIWSISVQEQFYLLWPWVILFVPSRYLIHAICLFILSGIISHYYLDQNEFGNILTIACLDSLGIGALVAWAVQRYPDQLPKIRSILKIATLIVFGVYVLNFVFATIIMPQRTVVSLWTAMIICGLIANNMENKKPSAFWNNNFLFFIGKISFGLYLFHQIIPNLIGGRLDRFMQNNLSASLQPYRYFFTFLIMMGSVFLAAWLSWTFIESRCLRLKKYFVSKPVKKEVPVVAVAGAPVAQQTEALQ